MGKQPLRRTAERRSPAFRRKKLELVRIGLRRASPAVAYDSTLACTAT